MDEALTNLPHEVLLRRFEVLVIRVGALESEIERLSAVERENTTLKLELASARKTSRNSSKPPSSDYVKPKPPPPPDGQSRRIGGQRGHTAHFRPFFTPDPLDESQVFDPPSLTCSCGGHLEPCPSEDRIQQQIDLPEQPIIRREYRARAYRRRSCGALHRGTLPDPVRREGYVGNRLAAAWSFLNVKAHASHTALAGFTEIANPPVLAARNWLRPGKSCGR